MAKHAWIQEHLAAYLAGGLDAQESAQLESHVASCPNCAKSLDEVRSADQALTALFAGVLPEDGMEDRVMHRLPIRRPLPRYMWQIAAAAAVLLVGFVGTMINQAIDKKELGFPDSGFIFDRLISRFEGAQGDVFQLVGGGGGAPWATEKMDEKYQFTNDHRTPIMAPRGGADGSEPAKVGSTVIAGNDVARYGVTFRQIGQPDGSTKRGETDQKGFSDILVIQKAEPPGSLMFGLAVDPLGDSSKKATKTGEQIPLDDPVIPLPLGHDKMSKDGFYTAAEFAYPRDGSNTGQTGQSSGQNANGEPARSSQFGALDNSNLKNLVSGLTPKGDLTQGVGVPIKGKLPGLQNSEDETADPFPPELQSALGYYPPSRALQVKGTSRLHTNLGADPSIGRGTQAAGSMGKESKAQAPTNLAFRPNDVTFGEKEPTEEFGVEIGLRSPVHFNRPVAPGGNPAGAPEGKPNTPSKAFGTPAFDFGLDRPAVPGNVVGKASQQAGGKQEKEPQGSPAKASTSVAPQPPAAQPAVRKVIIRSGEMEFEIEAFDAATAIINRLVDAIPGGFVATTNSEKLPNGKVRGSVVVRTPPEHLDALVSNLRKELSKGGELKSQRIGSQDITKQFTDLESRLRAARTMEERLLQIIKAGKGEIKDLLNVEKELGIWRTKIEEMEGELRFFAHQVSLSTLTITLAEKEIRAPYGVLETERTNMGIEVEDVEKAQVRTLAIVADVKGRITKSELKQMDAGQFNAVINFEVPPDAAGPVRDRLKQLGNLARYDVNRLLEAEGGTGKPQDPKVTRHDAQFFLSLYNLANVAPRETINIDVATPDAEAAYKALLTRVQNMGGRIVTWNLNRQNNDQTVGTISFQVKAAEADALIAELKALGETLRHQTVESADTQNTTKSKRGFLVQIMAFGAVPARETTALQLAAPDVSASYRKLQEAIAAAKGRMLSAQLNEQNRQNTSAVLDFEVRREEEPAMRSALAAQGEVLSRNVTRVPENENAISSKVRIHVALIDAARIPPRETTTLEIEPADVDAAATLFTSLVREQGGRTVESHVSRERNGRATSKLVFNVPLAAAAEVVDNFKKSGVVRVQDKVRNPQVPDGPLAVARIEVTLSNSDLIVPSDQGLWPQVRKGLSTSFVGLSWSLTVVIIGILFVLPWVLAIYAGFRVVRWMRGAPRSA